jgi:hypothetical protein
MVPFIQQARGHSFKTISYRTCESVTHNRNIHQHEEE